MNTHLPPQIPPTGVPEDQSKTAQQIIPNPHVDPLQQQRPVNPQAMAKIPPQQAGQFPPHVAGQQIQQQQVQRPAGFPNQSQVLIAQKIVNNAMAVLKQYKNEQQKNGKALVEQKMKEYVKKGILANERMFRSNKDYLEEQKKILQYSSNDLIPLIQSMTKIHIDKKNEIDLNIQKNIELLKFLQQYKSNNPQQNFQDRENSQQQVVNNYSKDDSFDAMVDEAQKEIREYNQPYNNQMQDGMEQEYYGEYNQNNEGQNNELMERANLENIGYNEENNEFDQY